VIAEKRKAEAERIRQKYPDRIPVSDWIRRGADGMMSTGRLEMTGGAGRSNDRGTQLAIVPEHAESELVQSSSCLSSRPSASLAAVWPLISSGSAVATC